MSLSKQDIIDIGYGILQDYVAKDLTMTIRQLYYQFIGRGHFKPVDKGDGDKFYKRVVNAMADGRLAGDIPFDWIEDRGRRMGETETDRLDNVDQALETAGRYIRSTPGYLRAGRWHGQVALVYVWVEKEALAGVLEGVCERLGVGLFPCKGYPSLSALRQWVMQTDRDIIEAEGVEAVILYMGDHDPDGMEIPLAAERRIQEIQDLEGIDFPFTVDRLALSESQARNYRNDDGSLGLPPFGAKVTSTRYAKYLRTTGTTDAWELDALGPDQLTSILEAGVEKYFDEDVHADNQDTIRELRREFIKTLTDPEWLAEQVEGLR